MAVIQFNLESYYFRAFIQICSFFEAKCMYIKISSGFLFFQRVSLAKVLER